MCSSKYEEEQLSAQSLKVKETSLSERELDLDEDEEIGMETVLPRRNARIDIKEVDLQSLPIQPEYNSSKATTSVPPVPGTLMTGSYICETIGDAMS